MRAMPRRPRALLALIIALGACTSIATAPDALAPDPQTPDPQASGPSKAVGPTLAREPLVIAVHATRPPIDLSFARAEQLIAGSIDDWSLLGEPAARLRVIAVPAALTGPSVERAASGTAAVARVREDPDAVAVVPGSAIGPGVRAATIDGIDPVRDPARAPLTIAGPPPGPVTTIMFVGDIMLARRVGARIDATGDRAFPLRLVAEQLAAADLTVGNVESTFARLGPPTQGDAFAADPRAVEGLMLAGVDVVSLANNHVGDFGSASLVETVRVLEEAGIDTFGAGMNLRRARRPAIVERNGIRIAFLGFNAIGETPPPGRDRPGAVRIRMQPRLGPLNDADLARMAADVEAATGRADVVIVMPHWGAQYTHRIHPDQRTVARAMIRAGADAVIGGHPHWVQGFELSRGAPIVYSLGNFVFDMDFMRKTQEGIGVEVVLWGDRVKAIEPIPVRIDDDFRPRFLSWDEGTSILDDVFASSRAPWRR